MTVNYQPNPLNTFDLRRIDFCPPHFYPVDFDLAVTEKRITDWIWEHLQGRFFFGDVFQVTKENNKRYTLLQKRASFEIHSEASYFAMLLNDINKF